MPVPKILETTSTQPFQARNGSVSITKDTLVFQNTPKALDLLNDQQRRAPTDMPVKAGDEISLRPPQCSL